MNEHPYREQVVRSAIAICGVLLMVGLVTAVTSVTFRDRLTRWWGRTRDAIGTPQYVPRCAPSTVHIEHLSAAPDGTIWARTKEDTSGP